MRQRNGFDFNDNRKPRPREKWSRRFDIFQKNSPFSVLTSSLAQRKYNVLFPLLVVDVVPFVSRNRPSDANAPDRGATQRLQVCAALNHRRAITISTCRCHSAPAQIAPLGPSTDTLWSVLLQTCNYFHFCENACDGRRRQSTSSLLPVASPPTDGGAMHVIS